jgi:hypothetical protein
MLERLLLLLLLLPLLRWLLLLLLLRWLLLPLLLLFLRRLRWLRLAVSVEMRRSMASVLL